MSHLKKGDNTRQVERIGLDIAKSSFQVHGVDAQGKVVVRKQLSRSKVLAYFAQLPQGEGRVRFPNGEVRQAELHWYEAHGIGRRKMKVKRVLD